MKRQAYQHPELRDANDSIIQEGTYGKESPLVNSDNTGVLDYINNNLEALHDAQTAAGNAITTGTLTVSGETSVPTANAGNSSKAIANTAYVQGELTNYLSLSGGTMTGYLQFNASEGRIQNYRSDNDGMVSVYGGQGYTSGGYLAVYGKNHASFAGIFRICARDDTNGTKELRGTPAGALTWGGKNIELVNAIGANYIRYESGLQMCWGIVGAGTSFTVTYPVAFNAEPSIATSPSSNVTISVNVSDRQNTGFVATLSASSYMRYIAIGKWK